MIKDKFHVRAKLEDLVSTTLKVGTTDEGSYFVSSASRIGFNIACAGLSPAPVKYAYYVAALGETAGYVAHLYQAAHPK